MAFSLFIMAFPMLVYTAESCLPPTDFKATVVNNYEDLQLTWKKPTTGLEVVGFVIYINKFNNRTKEPTYLIRNAQYQVYKISIDSNCGQFGYPSRFSVNIGFVGKAIYSTVVQSRVDIDWITTATLNDTVDIKNKDRDISIFILRRSNEPSIFETRFKNRITYNGNLRTNKISFTLSNVTSLDAGFYMSAVGTTDKGGRVLVVLDRPRKPTITNNNSYVGKSLELTCDSQKTSKPDYYTPELNYTWFLNGSIHIYKQSHQGRYSQIQNKLIIDNITRQDKGHRFSCKASDGGQQSEQSDTISLDPLYGPEIVILTPDTKDNVLKVGEKFGPINCSAECNPYCIFSWKFRKPGDTGRREEITRSNILTIDKITRKNAGEYRCGVRSYDSNTLPQTNTKTIDLNVQFQPEIKNITYLLNGGAKLVINNGQVLTVSANDDINLQCNIEANPKASISWKRNGQVLKHNSSGESLIYNLGQSISCETSGIYSCVADNGIMSAVQRNVSLRVQCKPKQSMLSPVRNRYGSKINSTVNVSLSIIAYPRPQHRWTSNTTGTIIERPTSEINLYSFNYESLVNIRRATDFGNYCLNLTNDKGSSLVCLQIQAEDVPLAPTNFTAESILPEMINLTWISQFNGGQEQTFYLEYKQKGDNSGFKKINMSDNGSGETIRASVKNLKSNAVYIFRLYSRNNIGNSSIKNLEVKTEAYPIKEPLSSNLTATLAGGIFAIAIVLVIVIIVIVIIRRRSSTNGKRKSTNEAHSGVAYSEVNRSQNNQNNEIPQGGANIDVVYGKVDKVNKSKKNEIKQNGASADVVYSEVQNPKNQTQQNGASADAVYSEVQKPKKQNAFKDDDGNIYENSALLDNSEAPGSNTTENTNLASGAENGRYKNEEGLIYIDVDVRGKKEDKKKGKPVVHGDEDRTEYISIDFTKKAES